jgi:hypothetical protein
VGACARVADKRSLFVRHFSGFDRSHACPSSGRSYHEPRYYISLLTNHVSPLTSHCIPASLRKIY